MAKRFTDTSKYKKPFIRGLSGPYKLFWDYLYHDCDHAGIWIVDFEIAQIYVGQDMPINREDAIKFFNEGETRIIEFDGGKKWFIKSFIEFQYGDLSEMNRAHNSVIQLLRKNNLLKHIKPHISPLQGAMVKDMVKDKVKDKKVKIVFEEARKIYPGTKRGLDTEFTNFKKKHKDWRNILPLLKPAIERQIQSREIATGFVPNWKNFQTWINNRCWEEQLKITEATKTGRTAAQIVAAESEAKNGQDYSSTIF